MNTAQHAEWLDAMRWLANAMPKHPDPRRYAGKKHHVEFSLLGRSFDNTEDDLRTRFFYALPWMHRCPSRCGDFSVKHDKETLRHISAEAMDIWKATTGLPLIYEEGRKPHEHKRKHTAVRN